MIFARLIPTPDLRSGLRLEAAHLDLPQGSAVGRQVPRGVSNPKGNLGGKKPTRTPQSWWLSPISFQKHLPGYASRHGFLSISSGFPLIPLGNFETKGPKNRTTSGHSTQPQSSRSTRSTESSAKQRRVLGP